MNGLKLRLVHLQQKQSLRLHQLEDRSGHRDCQIVLRRRPGAEGQRAGPMLQVADFAQGDPPKLRSVQGRAQDDRA